MKKILLITLIVTLISSCSGRMKKDQTDSQNINEQQYNAQTEEFQIIENESQAEEINVQTQAEIEEVEVPDRIFFDLDQSSINQSAKDVLAKQAAWLKSDESINVKIEGHCDERGTREYNLALGERRANSVKNYLISSGINGNRIKTISYGKERPAFLGSGEEIWSKNRRAVTIIEE